jgi:beta-glucuronidase
MDEDPYHHLHDETYDHGFARGRVGAGQLVALAGRTSVCLDGEWDFVLDLYDEGLRQRWYAAPPSPIAAWHAPRDYDGGAWQRVATPSSWNMLHPEWFHFEGAAWYGRTLHLDAPLPGERLVVHIGAANYEARVFLNGRFVGAHRGGSTPFCIEITDAARAGENRLLIQVDNRRRADRVPMHHTDWFNYGGLYRSVALLRLPAVFVRHFSVALAPDRASGTLRVEVELSDAVDEVAELTIAGLGGPWRIAIDGGHGSAEIAAAPLPWSPEQPVLYDVSLRCGADVLHDRVGFRRIEVQGERILLNGEDIFLRGICAHEDDLHAGKASSEDDIRRRFVHAKELGCNFMRLAHYPHDERAARIADEIGLLLWEEIPVYWAIDYANPDTYADAANQLAELIRRDANRASVIVWGVGNENADTDDRLSFMSRLARTARRLDPTRLVSAACLINRERFTIEDRLAEHLDVVGLNEYFGWYEPSFDGLRLLLAQSNPGKPVIITETGADAVAGRCGPATEFFTEECQAEIYRTQLSLLATAAYVRGICPWILYDFRTERRQTALQRGWNLKGLIAADKTTRKQAFHVLAAHYRRLAGQAAAEAPR